MPSVSNNLTPLTTGLPRSQTSASSSAGPRLPAEVWEMVFDHLDNESLVAVSRVSKQFNAMSLNPERLKQRILAEGTYTVNAAEPSNLLKKLGRIVQLRANLKGDKTTTLIEPAIFSFQTLVEVNGEIYDVISTKAERIRTTVLTNPLDIHFDMQSRPLQENKGALPGEKSIWQIKTPFALKRCGHEGRYLPVPQLPGAPQRPIRFAISKDMRFIAEQVDASTFITQEGNDVSTRTNQTILNTRDAAYVGTHLLLGAENEVRILDAQNGHSLVRSFVLPGILGASLSGDGRLLAVLQFVPLNGERLSFYDVSTGGMLYTRSISRRIYGYFRHLTAFDPTGRLFAKVDGKARLVVIDVRNGVEERLTAAEVEGDFFVGVCFSPMQDVMAVSTSRGNIRVYKKKGTELELLSSLDSRSTGNLRPALSPVSFNEAGSKVYCVDYNGSFKSIDMRGPPKKLALWKKVYLEVSTMISHIVKFYMSFLESCDRIFSGIVQRFFERGRR